MNIKTKPSLVWTAIFALQVQIIKAVNEEPLDFERYKALTAERATLWALVERMDAREAPGTGRWRPSSLSWKPRLEHARVEMMSLPPPPEEDFLSV
jgi:hypothetical protein